MKVKIKDKTIKSFDVEIKDLTMDERIDVTELIHRINTEPEKILRISVDVCIIGTGLDKDQLNVYGTDELYALARKIYSLSSKKKLKS